jgi:hypothetical protein
LKSDSAGASASGFYPSCASRGERATHARAHARAIFGAGDREQSGQFIYCYKSLWLPAGLLDQTQRQRLAEAIFAATRSWSVALHFNKGLAGATDGAIEAARNTAINPAALEAFALAIVAGHGSPAFPGIAGHEPDAAQARRRADSINRAMGDLEKLAPDGGSYHSESDYFQVRWREAFWGSHYARLLGIKKRIDPDALFSVHHCVSNES